MNRFVQIAQTVRRIERSMTTRLLGMAMLCALMIMGTLPMAGCSGATIAQDIVNWTPTLESTAATVAGMVALLQPQDALLVAASLTSFDAGANLVTAEAKAYLANPSQTLLQALQVGVVTFQQNVNAGLLAASKIVNPQSQAMVLAAVNACATVINAIFALIAGLKGNTIAAMATTATVTLMATRKLRDERASIRMVAAHYGESQDEAAAQVAVGELALAQRGF